MRYVYVITNLVNGKVYVGQTKDPVKRKAGHFSCARRGKRKRLYNAMRKHGLERFEFRVLEECADEIINEREQHWVAHYDSFNPTKGYNLTRGGNQGFEHSAETLRKIRTARAKQVITEDHRKHISEGLLRSSQIEEVKQSRCAGQAKRLPASSETRRRRSESMKGKNVGKPSPRKGKRLSEQHVRNLRLAGKRCINCGMTGHNKATCKENDR